MLQIIFLELDKNCFKWERFSSDGQQELSLSVGTVTTSTQTTPEDNPSKISGATGTQPPGPAVDNDNDYFDTGGDAGDDMDFDGGGASDSELPEPDPSIVTIDSSTASTPSKTTPQAKKVAVARPPPNSKLSTTSTAVANSATDLAQVSLNISRRLPFLLDPIDFTKKIFCTVDPENCKRFYYDDYNLQVHIRSHHQGNLFKKPIKIN